MCFSATASFAVAAATAATGLATIRQVRHPRELPLAVVPLLFAAQQAVEGVLWLRLPGGSGAGGVAALALAFLIFAKVLWPAYTAIAVLLIEPDRRRQRALWAIALVGSIVSISLLSNLLSVPPTVAIRGHSIGYASEVNALSWQQIPYLLCTCVPLLLSSHGTIRAFGAIILAGFLISAYVYAATFVSVWCFFAAADSTLLYFHFKRAAVGGRLLQH